jgi:hypothetical protein
MVKRFGWLAFAVFVCACGSSGKKAPLDAGPGDAQDAAGSDGDAADVPAGDVADAPVTLSDAGDAGDSGDASDATAAPDAADARDAADGPCVEGVCLEAVALAKDTDLSKDPIVAGRSCAAAPQYAVTSLSATTATLSEAPAGDCLAKGDEVLLLDAQGSPGDSAKVGTWELLKVASVAGNTVTFATSKTREYGAPAQVAADGGTDAGGGDAGAAIPAATQRILLARVPHFGFLKVVAGATLTTAPWNGTTGGVLALRAEELHVDGTISAATLGYRSGRWSQDAQQCVDSITTEAGESISGLGTATTDRNVGGSGGLGPASASDFTGNTPVSPSPGHATPGAPGANGGPRALGQPGGTYGVADGTLLTMGSGPGGNITCSLTATTLHLTPVTEQAAGIVALFVGSLTVGDAGLVSASPPPQSRDSAYAGGYVFVRGGKLDVGVARVTAKGSTANPGSASTAGMGNAAGDGYVVLDATGTITGTTAPAAHVITH